MSEIIPEYIGSKLSSFSSETESSMSSTEVENEKSKETNWKPDMAISGKKKKMSSMIKKGIKKKNGIKKKLPVNPSAISATPVASEEQKPTVEENTNLIVEPVITEGEESQQNITASLKSIPSRKKKTSKAPRKRSKKALPEITTQTINTESKANLTDKVEEITEETPWKPNDRSTEQSQIESLDTVETIHIQKTAVPTNDEADRSHAPKNREPQRMSDAEERKAFVENIRTETQNYLKKLAEERKQRQLEYEEFRKKLRSDLQKNHDQ